MRFFQIAGFGIVETAAWMFALSLMSAEALFVIMCMIVTSNLRETGRRLSGVVSRAG